MSESTDTGKSPLPLPPAQPKRLVYFGTPDMAVAPLEALHEAGFDIALVVTGADKRRGRGSESSSTPVKLAALALGLPVSHDPAESASVGADLGVVVAYGQILRRPLLEQLPMINLHFSLLPRWRGAAPVERALLAGDEMTGVCVMAVEEGLDTGAVYATRTVAIRNRSTADDLRDQLVNVGSRLLVKAISQGLNDPQPQEGTAVYASKITTEEMKIDWSAPAVQIDRLIRTGGAWTTFRDRRFKIHAVTGSPSEADRGEPGRISDGRVGTGAGTLRLAEVQMEGKPRVDFGSWLNGAKPTRDECLGAES